MKPMVLRVSVVIALLVAVAAFVILPRMNTGPAEQVAAFCPPLAVVLDRANTVYGLKEGNIFAYVDLAEMAPALMCHPDSETREHLTNVVTSAITDWWKEPRFADAKKAEVHVISVLDKDEYARANFNAALTHGKFEFTREGDEVVLHPLTLTFDNMRAKLDQK